MEKKRAKKAEKEAAEQKRAEAQRRRAEAQAARERRQQTGRQPPRPAAPAIDAGAPEADNANPSVGSLAENTLLQPEASAQRKPADVDAELSDSDDDEQTSTDVRLSLKALVTLPSCYVQFSSSIVSCLLHYLTSNSFIVD